ncbi:tRNA lysidine(34) synthetase TilS [Pectinatus sottacetonis]|uniref:tRNA lysidine(34) synthetase TilS n=1 Tax=Pectinatus sottacetonis TaxID=1002795 RepID=UPI0018C63BA6|nr:tRNA lysidine(34) synthetase TilS [Pectinatus sottacetonis]
MLKQIVAFCQKHRLFSYNDHILLACSGGPDSLCMVHIFIRLAAAYNLTVSVAHVEHGIRGRASVQDAAFVKDFCQKNNLPFYLKKVNAISYAEKNKLSVEAAARILRYSFLQQTATVLHCTSIAIAHHRGDQAETILMHMIRGAGTKGLSGINPRTNNIIRPLLNCTRSQIKSYCSQYNLVFRTDTTNYDTNYTRNSIRLKLLPFLHKYNPNIEETLCRTASLIAEENDFITTYADDVYKSIVIKKNNRLLLPLPEFTKQHIAIKRQTLRAAISDLCNNTIDIENIHIDNILSLAAKAKTGSSLNLPHNIIVIIEYNNLVLTIAEKSSQKMEIEPISINTAGTTTLPFLLGSISAITVNSYEGQKDRRLCYIDTDKICGKLIIRSRKNGDFFYPKGLNGRKKIKNLLIDNKIPREQRSKIPLLCDQKGIIWVVGIQQDQRYFPQSSSTNIIQLTLNTQNSK